MLTCPKCGYVIQNTFTDPRDGKVYKTVKIGDQIWMAENLNYAGTNGNLGKCYANASQNAQKYGRLYDWETAKKACPDGWHLPSKDEWVLLVKNTGGEEISGQKLKAKSGWNNYKGKSGVACKSGICTDKFDFSALPGGFGFPVDNFKRLGDYGYWWSASKKSASDLIHYKSDSDLAIYSRYMCYNSKKAYWYYYNKNYLLSVRCVQD